MLFSKIKNILKLYILKKRWRKKNLHNEIYIKKICNIENIEVGNMSYGPLEVYDWNSEGEGLKIGSYVSIANDVKFILGGNHKYDVFSTFPFKVKLGKQNIEAYTNGKIIVEDDVWIGMNALILSGVKLGKGSIVAAGSVVVNDIPPYAIVGGNPAKIIKYRFKTEIINELVKLDYSKLDIEKVKKNINLLYKKLDENLLHELINKEKIFNEIEE